MNKLVEDLLNKFIEQRRYYNSNSLTLTINELFELVNKSIKILKEEETLKAIHHSQYYEDDCGY
jgi:hypothetical protein